MSFDSRLGNLSFTGAGRDSVLAQVARGNRRWRGDEECGCCGAKNVARPQQVCGSCRTSGASSWQPQDWRDRVAAAVERERDLYAPKPPSAEEVAEQSRLYAEFIASIRCATRFADEPAEVDTSWMDDVPDEVWAAHGQPRTVAEAE